VTSFKDKSRPAIASLHLKHVAHYAYFVAPSANGALKANLQ